LYQVGEYDKAIESLKKLEDEFEIIENYLKTVSGETKSLLRTRGQMWSLLGASNEKKEDYEESTKYYNKALTNCLNIEDELGEAVIYNNLARILEKQDKFSSAKKFFEDALRILTKLKDKKIKCGSLYNLAEMCRKLGEYDESLKQFKKSFTVFSELLDDDSMGKVLYKMGKIYRIKKDYQKALEYQLESMKIIKFEDTPTDEPVLQILALKTRREFGLIFLMKGEIKLSLKYFGDALRIAFKSVGKGRRTGKILLDVAKVYDYIRKFVLALKYYKFALEDFKKVEDKYEISNIYNYIGEVYSSMKNYPEALENFRTSLYKKKEIGCRVKKRDVHITRVLINIGLVYRSREMYLEALEYFSKALKMLQEMGDRQGESATLNNIGIVYDSMKQYQKALKHFEKSLRLSRVLKNYNGQATIINNVGSIHLSLGDMKKSLKFYLEAYRIFGKIKNKFREATTGYNLAFFFYCLEEFERSKQFLERSLKLFKEKKCEVELLESKNFLEVVKTRIERERNKGSTRFLIPSYFWCCTLKEKLEKIKLNEIIFLNYTEQILYEMLHFFKQGIVHRNIKEENIIVGFNGNLLIGGFDKHTKMEEKTDSNFIWKVKGIDYSKVDIYAIGLICYNMLMKFPTNVSVSIETRKIVLKMYNDNPEKRISIKSAYQEVYNLLETKLCVKKNKILE
jgi:tetratricopeptide (TPR) repeat protein